jgi:hypothetical protein
MPPRPAASTFTATIIGDRFGVIDGQTTLDPTFEFFPPHVSLLTPGAHSEVDTRLKSKTGANEDGDPDSARERKTRAILAVEIQGELVNVYPGAVGTGEAGQGGPDPRSVQHAVLDGGGKYVLGQAPARGWP